MQETTQFLTAFIQTFIRQTEYKQFMLSLSLRGALYQDDCTIQATEQFINVLVSAKTNYVGIWIHKSADWIPLHELTNDNWEFQSYHDSCWRTDGMNWMFNTFLEVRADLVTQIKAKSKVVSVEKLNSCIEYSPNSTFFTPVSFDKEQVQTETFRGYKVTNFKLEN